MKCRQNESARSRIARLYTSQDLMRMFERKYDW
jgi:hypothetical protein